MSCNNLGDWYRSYFTEHFVFIGLLCIIGSQLIEILSFNLSFQKQSYSLNTFYVSFFLSYAKSTKPCFRTQTSHQRSVAFSDEIPKFSISAPWFFFFAHTKKHPRVQALNYTRHRSECHENYTSRRSTALVIPQLENQKQNPLTLKGSSITFKALRYNYVISVRDWKLTNKIRTLSLRSREETMTYPTAFSTI